MKNSESFVKGESKQNLDPRRTTKNSRRVATLEEQNKILQEVLAASKSKDGGSGKATPEGEKETPLAEKGKIGGKGKDDRKRRADEQSEEPPAKKAKDSGNENGPGDQEGTKGKKLILEYPDYDKFPLTDDGENQLEFRREDVKRDDAGKTDTSQHVGRHEVPAAQGGTHHEHELSIQEEDDINGEEQNLSDYEEEDDYVGGDGWDMRSVSSSTIFPSGQSGPKPSFTATRHAKGGIEARPSSRPVGQNNNKGVNSTESRPVPKGFNPVEDLVKERVGAEEAKDSVGPPVEECIVDLLRVFLKEPNAENVLKLVENYPRPVNAEWLQAPAMGNQVAAAIPKRSNNYDKRLKQSQVCLGGSLGALALVLQDIMLKGKSYPELLPLARRVIDAMMMTGYVHADFNSIRKGAIHQVINLQFAGVFTRRTSSTPENLMGESPVPDQLKEQEELSKVRAKLQKPRKGNNDHRNENFRGRGRSSFPGGNRGGSHNRGSYGAHGSGFGRPQNFHQRGGRGTRPFYPQQRRVYGNQNQNNNDLNGGKDQNKM